MRTHPHRWAGVAVAVALALALAWAALPRQKLPSALDGAAPQVAPVAAPPVPLAHARQPQPAPAADALLAPGLRHGLETLLLEAGDAGDPAVLRQRLAGLVDARFPQALRVRALALAERYVDYRVALGRLHVPQEELQGLQEPGEWQALRDALQARNATRRQFFDGAEYAALFAQEDEQDQHALARIAALQDPGLSPAQREQALQAADRLLSEELRAQRAAASAHLAAAAQTAELDARHADPATRHAARSARFGAAAAQALAALDHEEQHWQQRLDQYRQALDQSASAHTALQPLRQQLFSAEEQLRLDAALALRKLAPARGR